MWWFKFVTFILVGLSSFSLEAASKKLDVAFIAGLTSQDPNTAKELVRGIAVYKHLLGNNTVLEVKTYDNEGSVEKTLAVLEAAYREGKRFFVGMSNSNEAMAAAKFIKDRPDTLFITSFATNTRITQQSERVFRVCYDDDAQGKFLAHYANTNINPKRVLVLTNIESLYSQELSSVFLNNIKNAKTHRIDYISSLKDKNKMINESIEFAPDLVFVPDNSQTSANVVKLIYPKLPHAKYMGGDGWGGQTLFQAILPPLPNMRFAYTTYWHKDINTPQNKIFLKAYSDLFGADNPTSGAALAYETLSILNQAARSNDAKRSVEDIRKYLTNSRFIGTTGEMTFFRGSGTPRRKIVLMLLDEGGQYRPRTLKF